MIRTISLTLAFVSVLALSASAQDVKPLPAPGTVASPTINAAPTPSSAGIVLTEQEGKSWIDKPIYSSDGVKLGEVVVFQRDGGNKVIGMHADIGGFLGYMQTRVTVMPAQFKLQGDRIVLELTAEQSKSLPKVQS